MEPYSEDDMGETDINRFVEEDARRVADDIVAGREFRPEMGFQDEQFARLVQQYLKERHVESEVTIGVDGTWNLRITGYKEPWEVPQEQEEEVSENRVQANRRNWQFARRNKRSGQFKHKKGWFGESFRHRLARLKGSRR